MAITFTFEDQDLQLSLAAFAASVHKDFQDILRPECRLICVELAKYTQPFGDKPEDKAKGEKTVKRDFYIVYPSPQKAQDVDFLATMVSKSARPNDREKAKQRFRNYISIGNLGAAEKMLDNMHVTFHYGREANPEYHDVRWSGGRLRRGVSQVVLKSQSVDKLIKEATKKVGFAKGGWAACARQLGGVRGIPGWVTRQKSPGEVIDDSKNPENPSITMTNNADYTSRVLSEANKASVIRDRIFKIQEKTQKALDYNAQKYIGK